MKRIWQRYAYSVVDALCAEALSGEKHKAAIDNVGERLYLYRRSVRRKWEMCGVLSERVECNGVCNLTGEKEITFRVVQLGLWERDSRQKYNWKDAKHLSGRWPHFDGELPGHEWRRHWGRSRELESSERTKKTWTKSAKLFCSTFQLAFSGKFIGSLL